MYQGRHASAPAQRAVGRRAKNRGKAGSLLIAIMLIVIMVTGGTLAYLVHLANPVVNTFLPSQVSCEVDEDFDNNIKSNVTVINTSNIDAYLRVKLISYRVMDVGETSGEDMIRIGGTAVVPGFTPGEGWVENGGYYYYNRPVAPGKSPDVPLIGAEGIALLSYNDGDGGKQVIEVMAEAVQAEGVDEKGTKAVVLAWGLDPETLS